MGHIRLGRLPKSKSWRAVVGLLTKGAPDDEIVSASTRAIERELASAVSDPIFVEAVRLLCLIPQAARSTDFGTGLRGIGVDVPDQPELTQVLTAVGRHLDNRAARVGRSDFAELSRRALIGTLASEIGATLPGLFGSTPSDVRLSTARLSYDNGFSRAARAFFARLMSDTLSSWLDRTLSTQVGNGLRFADAADRAAFDLALGQHCVEATRIIREFASGWYAKTIFRDGTVTSARAAGFAAISFKKISQELRARETADA
jgi:hypothetical protein